MDPVPFTHWTFTDIQEKLKSIDTSLKVIAVTLIVGLLFAIGVVAHAERWLS